MNRIHYLSAVLFLIGVLAVGGCTTPVTAPESPPAPAGSPTAEPEITILAFGDSLTEGFGVATVEAYPAQLESKLQQDGYSVRVINGGISGETSTSALARLDWMLNAQPDIVIVETGANDALRGVDLALTRENIDEIVQRISDSGAVVIVAGLQIVQNLGEEYTTDFAEIYPFVAEKHASILIPFVLEGVAANPDLNQDDFIHPTGDGYTVMVDHIYPFVLQAIQSAQAR
jgi:acyl-CoA thioesterase-1